MPDHTPLLTTRSFLNGEIDLTILSRKKSYHPKELRGKTAFLMISVKNKSFSNRLVENFCQFAGEYLGPSYITIVDTPYLNNIYANHNDEGTQKREIDKLMTISEQTDRRIRRILGKRQAADVSLVSWMKLEQQTPDWLKQEVNQAFAKRGALYRDILARTKEVLPRSVDNRKLEEFSRFMVQEIPVLCYLYYLSGEQVVDVYPGEQPDFLWKIEAGHYREELPAISDATENHSGLIYVDFRMTAKGTASAQ